MIRPGYWPVEFYKGDSSAWRVVIWLDTHRTYPYDLAGIQAKAEIREKSGALRLWSLTCVVTLPNIIDITLPASVSRDLPDEGVWDLQLTDMNNSERVVTILRGPVTVIPDVTDSRQTITRTAGVSAFPKRGVRVA